MADQVAGQGRPPASWHRPPASTDGAPGLVGRVLGPVAVAALLALIGARTLAVVALVVGLTTVVLASVWPAFGRRLARVLHLVSHGVGVGLSAVLMGAVAVFVVAPVGVVLRLLRRDVLAPDGVEGGWHVRSSALRPLPGRTYAQERAEAAGGRSTAWRFVQVGVTSVLVLLLLDLGLGWTWDRTLGNPDVLPPAAPTSDAVGVPVAPSDDGERERLVDTSWRADLPSMAGSPWAQAYFDELDTMPWRFDPFIVARPQPFDGEYITMAEDTRVSYRPAALPEDAPVVWFFGGSTMFGEGQRDEHTIPSEVARLAEDAGTPVRVVNFGQRGWVIWQELLQLDQQLAVREAPDLVVFYDGTNEVNVMAEQGGNQPTVYNADDLRATFEGGAVTDAGEVAEEQPLDEAIFEVWRDTSLVGEIAREARQVLSVAPAAAGEVPDPGADPREVVDEAVAVYQRARDRVIDLTERHDVETLFFWQPKAESTTSPDGPMRTAARLVGSPTIDLSLALSSVPGDQVFIDGGHTNELGALLVAQAMWPYIESQVVAPAEGGSGGS